MTPIPMASFLAGSLLTLLMPVALLSALSIWYFAFMRREDPSDTAELGRSGAEASGVGASASDEAAKPAATHQSDGP